MYNFINYSLFTVTVYSTAHRTIVHHAQCCVVKTMPTIYNCYPLDIWRAKSPDRKRNSEHWRRVFSRNIHSEIETASGQSEQMVTLSVSLTGLIQKLCHTIGSLEKKHFVL